MQALNFLSDVEGLQFLVDAELEVLHLQTPTIRSEALLVDSGSGGPVIPVVRSFRPGNACGALIYFKYTCNIRQC